MILSVKEIRSREMIAVPDAWSHLKNRQIRIGINYSCLVEHGASLIELTEKFDFWLYDFAPPGVDWRRPESSTFSGIVFIQSLFNDNYKKFTFPKFIATLREKRAEVIVRSHIPL